MPITCDTCGKIADVKNKPEGVHWFAWMMDKGGGDDAIIAMPTENGEIGVICKSCVAHTLDDWNKSRDASPNV